MKEETKYSILKDIREALGQCGREVAFEVIAAAMDYMDGAFDGIISGEAELPFAFAKKLIDREESREGRNRENGRLGGNPAFRAGQKNPYYHTEDNRNITPLIFEDNPDITPLSPECAEDKEKKAPHTPKEKNNITQDNILELEKIEKESAERKGKRTAAEREQELAGKEETLRGMVRAYSDRYPESMLEAFVSYWTEPNKSRTRLRYELEKTWDTGRRLVTWASRDRTYAPRQPAAPPEDVYAMNERLRRESQERIARKYGTNGQEGQS